MMSAKTKMTYERAIAILSTGSRMPENVPHTSDELDEACELACQAMRILMGIDGMPPVHGDGDAPPPPKDNTPPAGWEDVVPGKDTDPMQGERPPVPDDSDAPPVARPDVRPAGKKPLFRAVRDGRSGRDCAHYRIDLSRPCTVRDFVDAVLKRETEHGTVTVRMQGSYRKISGEFRHGKLTSAEDRLAGAMDRDVTFAAACGGWGRMDYTVTVPAGAPL